MIIQHFSPSTDNYTVEALYSPDQGRRVQEFLLSVADSANEDLTLFTAGQSIFVVDPQEGSTYIVLTGPRVEIEAYSGEPVPQDHS